MTQQHGVIFGKIQSGIESAKAALEDIKAKLAAYDAQYKATETAASFLKPTLERAGTALTDLTTTVSGMKDQASEIPVRALNSTLAAAHAAVNAVVEKAHEYDSRFKVTSTVTGAISAPREQLSWAIATVASHSAAISASTNAKLQGISDGLRAKLVGASEKALDITLPVAARADTALGVSDRATAASAFVVERAKELDDRFGLSGYISVAVDRAQHADHKLTGGKVSPLVYGAYNSGAHLAGYVNQKYQDVKHAGCAQ